MNERLARFWLGLTVTLALTRVAYADHPSVLVVRPSNAEAAVETLVNHARGELTADGFEVVVLGPVAPSERVELLTREGKARSAAISIGLFLANDGSSLEMWLLELSTGRLAIEPIDAQSGGLSSNPKILARRMVDLVRAKLLRPLVQNLVTSAPSVRAPSQPAPSVAPPPPSHPPTESPRIENRGAFGIGAGLGVLSSFEGVGPVGLPLLRVHYGPLAWLRLRATAATFGSRARVVTALGRADVAQSLGLAEIVVMPWPRQRVRPVVSLGVGGHHVEVDGFAAEPYQGQRSDLWAVAMDGGLGASTHVGSNIEIAIEGHLLLTSPGVAIRFDDVAAARLGRPSGFLTFTVSWEHR